MSTFETSESSEQTTIQPPARAAYTFQNDLNGYNTFATIQQVDPNNLLQSSMAVSSQHLTRSDFTTAFPTTEAVDNRILPTITISQTSMHIGQSTEPPRDSKGSIICDRVECGSIIFRTNSAWR
jgi:hypothetical protein